MLVDLISEKLSLAKGNVVLFKFDGSYVYYLLKQTLRDGAGEFSFTSYSDGFAAADLVRDCNTFGFFAESKTVLVTTTAKELAAKEKEALIGYLSAPSDSTLLVLAASNAVFDFAKSYATVIDFSKTEQSLLISELIGIATRLGVKLTYEAANEVLRRSNGVMEVAVNETTKLCYYVSSGATVTVKDIDQCVLTNVERQVFHLTTCISAGKTQEALDALAYFKEKSFAPSFIMSALTTHFRRSFYALITSLSEQELADIFNVKPYAIKKSREQLSGFTQLSVKRVVDKLYYSEYRFKTGYFSDGSALDNCMAYIITVLRKKSAR